MNGGNENQKEAKGLLIYILALLVLVVGTLLGISDQAYLALARRFNRTDIQGFYSMNPDIENGIELMEALGAEDVYITSRDGLRLHGYFYAGKGETTKYVIYAHGYHSSPREEFSPFFSWYRDHGYGVLILDDRGHRGSEGKLIGFAVPDRLDLVDWCKYLLDRFGENIHIRLHGFSMGSATVMAASGEPELPEQVTGVVANSGYTCFLEITKRLIKKQMHLPVFPFAYLSEFMCKLRTGYGFRKYAPIRQVKKAKVPIFFVQGLVDSVVPPYMAKELYDACPTRKYLLEVPGADHGDAIILERERYLSAMEEFFGE